MWKLIPEFKTISSMDASHEFLLCAVVGQRASVFYLSPLRKPKEVMEKRSTNWCYLPIVKEGITKTRTQPPAFQITFQTDAGAEPELTDFTHELRKDLVYER
jgi:hypothetical protein